MAILEYFICLPLGFITKSSSNQFSRASYDSQTVISPLFFKLLLYYSLQFVTLYLPLRNFFIALDPNILIFAKTIIYYLKNLPLFIYATKFLITISLHCTNDRL